MRLTLNERYNGFRKPDRYEYHVYATWKKNPKMRRKCRFDSPIEQPDMVVVGKLEQLCGNVGDSIIEYTVFDRETKEMKTVKIGDVE